MSNLKETIESIKIPDLQDKNIGVMYSGGMDSSVVAAMLLKKGYDITLITVDNGAFKYPELAKDAATNLHKLQCKGKIIDHVYLSSFDIFQEMTIRKISEDTKKYGKDYSCVGCKLGMMASTIVYSKANNINILMDGFVKAQEFYPEQTNAYISFIDKLCAEHNIEHFSPIYNLSDKEQIKRLAINLNIPPRSIDSICLFEERPLEVDEKEIHDYVQSKESYIKRYIEFYEAI